MADQNTSGDFPKDTSVSTPPNPAKPNVPHYMTKYGEPSSGKKPEIPPPANSPKGTPAESLKSLATQVEPNAGGLIPWVGTTYQGMDKPLGYTDEDAESFLEEFEAYANARGMSDRERLRHVKKLTPKKVRNQLRDLYEPGTPWKQVKAFLLKYAARKRREGPDHCYRTLQRLAKKRPRGKEILPFLQIFEEAASLATEVSNAEKIKLLEKTMPRQLLVRTLDKFHNGKPSFPEYLTKLTETAHQDKHLGQRRRDGDSSDSSYDSDSDSSEDTDDDSSDDDGHERKKRSISKTSKTAVKTNQAQVDDLASQFAGMEARLFDRLSGMMQARLEGAKQGHSTTPRQKLCLFCDQPGHYRSDCTEFFEAVAAKKLRLSGKQVLFADGSVATTRFGQGGIKAALAEREPRITSSAVTISKIPDQWGIMEMSSHLVVRQAGAIKRSKCLAGEPADAVVEDRSLNGKHKSASSNQPQPAKIVNHDDDDDGGMEEIEVPSPGKQTQEKGTEVPTRQRKNPKYHLVAKIDEVNSDELVMEHLGRGNLGLSTWEYLAVVPRARKLVRQHLVKHREYLTPDPIAHGVQVDDTSESDSDGGMGIKSRGHSSPRSAKVNTRVLRLPTMVIPAMIGGAKADVLIDTGSEVNLVPARLAKLLPEGAIQLHPDIPKVFGVGESAVESGKAVWDVLVTTGQLTVPTSFLVVNDKHQQTILGMPWLSSVDWVVSKGVDGQKQLVVTWNNVTERFTIPEGPISSMVRSLMVMAELPMVNAARFKPVHKKIRPVAAPIPDEFKQEYPITGRDVFDEVDINGDPELQLTDENVKTLVIGDGELTPKEIRYFLGRLREVDQVFAFTKQHLGMIKPEFVPPIRVATVPHTPWNYKPFAVPRAMHDKVVQMLRDRLETGVIEPSEGPYASRWFTLLKKDGVNLRFIQDFQPVNAVTIRNAGVPPVADEMAEELSGCSLITKFDLYSGYDQIPIDPRDRDIFAINTPIGLVHMTRLPMGWANSVSAFQRVLTSILHRHMPDRLSLFVDDGVVKTRMPKTEAEIQTEEVRQKVIQHADDVVSILSDLMKAGLVISGMKSAFAMTKVEVLGYMCTTDGRCPTDSKVAAIQAWDIPASPKDVRSFIATCAFLRIWIPHFSTIAGPLYALTRQRVKFEWGPEQSKAFETLKKAITEAPLIRAPRYGEDVPPLILTTDASPIGAGAVLGQMDNDGQRYVIRYESYLFSDRERRYSQIKRELFATYMMVKKLRRYLYGVFFILEIDAQPLIGLINCPDLPGDVASRWIGYLKMFDFEIRHIKGVDNPITDALSRLPMKGSLPPPQVNQLKVYASDGTPIPVLKHSTDAGMDVTARVDIHFEPFETVRVPTGLHCTPPDGTYIRIADRSSMALRGFRVGGGVVDPSYTGEICVIMSNELNRSQDIKQGDRVAQFIMERFARPEVIQVPKEAILGEQGIAGFGSTGVNVVHSTSITDEGIHLGVNEIKQAGVKDHGKFSDIIQFLKTGSPNKDLTANQRAGVKQQSRNYLLESGMLFKREKMGLPRRVISDPEERIRVIKAVHGGHPSGHRGIKATYRMCASRFFWPKLYKDIERVIRTCDICQRNPYGSVQVPLKVSVGSTVFSRIGIDLTELEESADGHRYLVVARDDLSGWVEARALTDKKSSTVYQFLYEDIISRFGIPGEILADRGELWGKVVAKAARQDGLTLKFTTAYHPQTNGMIERGHRDLVNCLKKLCHNQPETWPGFLHAALWADRTTVKSTTGLSPYRLIYGQDCTLPFDLQESTWVSLPWQKGMSTDELLQFRSIQLIQNSWLRELAGINLDESRQRGKKYFERRHPIRRTPFQPGDMVLLKDTRLSKVKGKLRLRWRGPYVIDTVIHEDVYTLCELDGAPFKDPTAGVHLRQYFHSV